MDSPSNLAGRIVALTGATGGIGGAIARKLAVEGMQLVLVGRNRRALEDLQSELGHAVVAIVEADLSIGEDIGRIVREAVAAGEVDILINNAGTFLSAPVFEIDDAAFEQSLAVNLVAPFRLARAFARGMAERGWGRIVNIGSSSSYSGFAGGAAYCSTKHGLLGLSRSLQAELGSAGVRVHCVSPGSVKSEMGRQVPNQDFDTFIEPRDVAEAVAFLLGQDGNAVTEELRLNRMVLR